MCNDMNMLCSTLGGAPCRACEASEHIKNITAVGTSQLLALCLLVEYVFLF